MSADELLQLPDDGFRYELVRGELRKMSPSGARHGEVAANINTSLGPHVRQNGLGKLYGADAGFRLSRNPDTVRAPDLAFVRTERAVRTAGFFEGPPDVAFEVVSPSDSYTEIDEKTLDWLRAGTRVVVIADPRTMSVRVHRSASAHSVTDVLELDDVIPGWRMPLAEIFE
ncbi:MAG TPA: Uma2 family endonuclease [Thermoanaerobaculia bacterium]